MGIAPGRSIVGSAIAVNRGAGMMRKILPYAALMIVAAGTSGCHKSLNSIVSEADAITPFTPGSYCKYDLNKESTGFDTGTCETVTVSLSGKTYTLRHEGSSEVYKVRIDKETQGGRPAGNVTEACSEENGVTSCYIG